MQYWTPSNVEMRTSPPRKKPIRVHPFNPSDPCSILL